ncbi:hypothetical protein PUN28_003464 [Cardiocondyla obscurior]|uniref:Uncharacterized protein n=1 Tax=Cardiocondyla obscurior TaxID=286306 RepID=A0AAW2GKZ1_9HYME
MVQRNTLRLSREIFLKSRLVRYFHDPILPPRYINDVHRVSLIATNRDRSNRLTGRTAVFRGVSVKKRRLVSARAVAMRRSSRSSFSWWWIDEFRRYDIRIAAATWRVLVRSSNGQGCGSSWSTTRLALELPLFSRYRRYLLFALQKKRKRKRISRQMKDIFA